VPAADDSITGVHRVRPAASASITRVRASEPAFVDSITRVRASEPALDDSVTGIQVTGPAFDHAVTRSVDDSITRVDPHEIAVAADDVIATEPALGATDPDADPTNPEHRERAEAYQLALAGQLASVQRRLAAAEAQQPAMREQIASLQRRLAEAEARGIGAA